MIWKIKKGKESCPRTIAITGAQRGMGVTHFGLSIANYLSSAEGRNVTYLEVTDRSDLMETVKGKTIIMDSTVGYEYLDVRYAVSCRAEEAIKILLHTSDIVVVDIQTLSAKTKDLFFLCQKRIVIGSISPWCIHRYEDFINENIYGKCDTRSISFYIRGDNKKEKSKLEKRYSISFHNLPNVENPFSIKENEFDGITDMTM